MANIHQLKLRQLTLMLLCAGVVTACASTPDEPVIGKVDVLYNQGMDELQHGKLEPAIHTFEELERQYPYSGWATRAQMMTAFAQYRAEKYNDAIATIDRFLRLHPGHEDADYMYYLKGMSFYTRLSNVKRDQGFTHEALKDFEELVRRYPDSKYTRDARLKITLCRDHIAGQEMAVGRFYQQQERYLAAINRFKEVVDKYPRTAQAPEALYRLTESYLSLGLKEQAKKTAAVLGHNYPDTHWYQKAYKLMTDANAARPDDTSTLDKVGQGLEDLF